MKQTLRCSILACSVALAGSAAPADDGGAAEIPSVRLAAPAASGDESAPPGLRLRVREGYDAIRQGDYTQALQKFGAALRLDSGQPDALFGMATVLTKMDQVEKAEVVYERLLEVNPGAFEVLNNMAWMYATTADPARRNPARAIELVQRALLIQPDNFHVWSTLSAARYLNRDYEQAHRAAMEAYRLAEQQGLRGPQLEVYAQQVLKCRSAMQAMMLVD